MMKTLFSGVIFVAALVGISLAHYSDDDIKRDYDSLFDPIKSSYKGPEDTLKILSRLSDGISARKNKVCDIEKVNALINVNLFAKSRCDKPVLQEYKELVKSTSNLVNSIVRYLHHMKELQLKLCKQPLESWLIWQLEATKMSKLDSNKLKEFWWSILRSSSDSQMEKYQLYSDVQDENLVAGLLNFMDRNRDNHLKYIAKNRKKHEEAKREIQYVIDAVVERCQKFAGGIKTSADRIINLFHVTQWLFNNFNTELMNSLGTYRVCSKIMALEGGILADKAATVLKAAGVKQCYKGERVKKYLNKA